MEFARPWFLSLLLLSIVPLVWRRRHTAFRFSSFLILPRDPISRSLELVERGLAALFVAAAVLSLSGPRSVPRIADRWTEGARLVFVVDQSASMFSPWSGEGGGGFTKIAAAKEAVREFVERRTSDQVALIGFGKASILYTPLTADHRRFRETLVLLQSDMGDTVIDAALLRALELLGEQGSGIGNQAVILLSDGAGRVFEAEEIGQRFRAAGVNLYWLRIEGGMTGNEGLDALLSVLGPWGKSFVVGERNELPQALDAVGILESGLIKVESWSEGRSWTRPSWVAALGALLALGLFAFGERAARTAEGAR